MNLESKQQLVFIVEDDKFYTELLSSYFSSKNGFKVLCFDSGEECLNHLHLMPNFIIIDYFLDKTNPNAINGKKVYLQVKNECPHAKVVFISAQQSADLVLSLVKEGVVSYLVKNEETFNELDVILDTFTL